MLIKKVFVQSEFVAACFLGNPCRTPPNQTSIFFEVTSHEPSVSLRKSDFSVLVWHSSASDNIFHIDEGLTIMLHGTLYALEGSTFYNWPSQVAELYRSDVRKLGERLRGSFVLLVIDHIKEEVVILTDRTGSRKVFSLKDQDVLWFSSSASLLPPRNADPAGVVSYMVNDFIHSGRTLLEEIYLLKPACIHVTDRNGTSSETYWQFVFSEQHIGSNTVDLQDQYAELMRQSIRRRLPADGQILISLSGGIDSRAVIGLLASEPGIKERLIAFSYGTHKDEDVIVARRVCDFIGIPHYQVSFQGDLAATIRKNGVLCEGLVSFYTHGIDGLYKMAPVFRNGGTLFVADIAFRQGDQQYKDFDDMLSRGVGIRTPLTIPTYFKYGTIPPGKIKAVLDRDVDTIKARCTHIGTLSDCNQFLLIDQRQCYMLLPWREFYAGHFLPIANPLIDEDIIDFAAGISSDQRRDKRLHRETIHRLFPELCDLGFAKSGVDNAAVHTLMRIQRQSIIDLVMGYKSRLDTIVPPEVILAALIDLIHRMKTEKSWLPKSIRFLLEAIPRRYYQARMRSNMKHLASRECKSATIPHLSARQIEKLLAIRYYLRKAPEDGKASSTANV